MKKKVCLLVVGLFALTLTACAGKDSSLSTQKIRCPACGYSFNTPADG
jgi:hypothetical protein